MSKQITDIEFTDCCIGAGGIAAYKVATLSSDFLKSNSIQCERCGTIIMPQRIGTHCNCGRVTTSRFGLVVFNVDELAPVIV